MPWPAYRGRDSLVVKLLVKLAVNSVAGAWGGMGGGSLLPAYWNVCQGGRESPWGVLGVGGSA